MKLLKTLAFTLMTASILGACTAAGSNGENENKEEKGANATEAVINNIMTRTSIRQFTSQPIQKDTLDVLVKAGMAAPSAMDKRPWAFVVVTEKAVLDSLNAIHPYANLKTATAAIIVCGNKEKFIEGPGAEYWVQDCSAATENILLAAHAYGLGAVWCGVYPIEERIAPVKQVLGMPENIIPLNIITLGYPDQRPEPKDKWDAGNVHYQRW